MMLKHTFLYKLLHS